jgi:hypothetical protein
MSQERNHNAGGIDGIDRMCGGEFKTFGEITGISWEGGCEKRFVGYADRRVSMKGEGGVRG